MSKSAVEMDYKSVALPKENRRRRTRNSDNGLRAHRLRDESGMQLCNKCAVLLAVPVGLCHIMTPLEKHNEPWKREIWPLVLHPSGSHRIDDVLSVVRLMANTKC